MYRSFSESITSTYIRERINESSVEPASLQKVLRLFGYGTGKDTRYVCCLSNDAYRIDVHKFKIGQQNLVMCIITENRQIKDSALWSISDRAWNMLSKYDFGSAYDIDTIDGCLRKITNDNCEALMRYAP